MINFTQEDFDVWYMGKCNKKIDYVFDTSKKIIIDQFLTYFGVYKRDPTKANFDEVAHEITRLIINTLLFDDIEM